MRGFKCDTRVLGEKARGYPRRKEEKEKAEKSPHAEATSTLRQGLACNSLQYWGGGG